MLIGGDDINNDVISTCFSMFAYIRARFRFALIGGNLTAQSTGATGELEVEFKFQRRSCKLSFLFPPRRKSSPESLLAGLPFLESADNFSDPKSSFMFALFSFMIKVSINFENDTMKVSVNEAKCTD